MTTTKTKITTDYSRELNVAHSNYDVNLHVKDTDGFYGGKGEVYTGLTHGEAAQLANALVGENATVITDLPEAKLDCDGRVVAGPTSRSTVVLPQDIMETVKGLLSIHAFITKRNEEQAAAKVAAEAAAKAAAEAAARSEKARNWRRDVLATEFVGMPTTYASRSTVFQKAIDRIISLETAAEV